MDSLSQSDDYQLQAAATQDFFEFTSRTISDSGSITLTGYPDGIYYFRAGLPGSWSGIVQVEVQHHSLSRAFAFFTLGLLLFLVLVGTIVLGNKAIAGVSD